MIDPRIRRRGAGRAALRSALLTLLCAVLAAPPGARAACSRPIKVPVTATGFSVIVAGDRVSGVFPDVLRELGARMGCSFQFQVVPWARATYMFNQTGESDLMLPASRTPERDRSATYVPMMKLKMALVTLRERQLAVGAVDDLLAGRLHGITVRSYLFGAEYNQLNARLQAQSRLDMVNDPLVVARMLKARRADFSIMPPSIMLSALSGSADLDGLAGQLEFSDLAGLPPTESGVYISRRSLSAADQQQLRQLLEAAARGPLASSYRKYYPPALIRFAIIGD